MSDKVRVQAGDRAWEGEIGDTAGINLNTARCEIRFTNTGIIYADPAPVTPKSEPVAPPSWDDAPEWAQWLAQDQNGSWRWYKSCPSLPAAGTAFYWWANDGSYEVHRPVHYIPNLNWRDTLQERPKPEPPCPVCGKPAGEHRDGLFCCGHCGREVRMVDGERLYGAQCQGATCGIAGLWYRMPESARAAWNRRV